MTWQGLRAQTAPAPATQTATPPPAAPPPGATPATPVAPAVPQPPSPNVQIVFVTVPPANATVTWGKTRLGRTAGRGLVVTRPRDSGPLDVVVRAPGFLPVHTRAHTFGDHRVSVKLTRLEEINTLLGYKAPLDAGVPLDPTAVDPALSEMPPSLMFTPAPGTTPATPAPAPVPAPAPAPAPATGATPAVRP